MSGCRASRPGEMAIGALRRAVVREPTAIRNAKFYSRSHDAVIRVSDAAGNVIETPSTRASSKSGERYARMKSVPRSQA